MLAIFLVPFALTGKTTASCLLSLLLISALFPKQDTAHQPFGISSIRVVTRSPVQFALTAACADAKSKALVIWAPTVVMRHLQCRRPNQIFGCASSDAISHIVTVVLAKRGGTWAGREEPKGGGGGVGKTRESGGGQRRGSASVRSSSPPPHLLFVATMLGQGPGLCDTDRWRTVWRVSLLSGTRDVTGYSQRTGILVWV